MRNSHFPNKYSIQNCPRSIMATENTKNIVRVAIHTLYFYFYNNGS